MARLTRTMGRVLAQPLRRPTGWLTRPLPGQATVEFILVLPVLLLLLFVAIDVGRMFFDYIGLRTAAMDGAIYGARGLGASADIEQQVADHFLPNGLPAGTNIDVVRDPSCADVGGDGFVTVTASREFTPLTIELLQFAAPDTDWTFTVQSRAKTRCMT